KETVLTFKNIVVKDGILNLDMAASANNATISGISIVGYDGVEAIEKSPSLTSLNFNMTNSAEILSYGKKFHNLPSDNLKTSGTNVATHSTASNNKLFHKSRFAEHISYAIPVPNGTYTVETYHIETYYGQSGRAEKAGQRVFDISLEGKLVKDNFDMFLENGNKETVLTFNNIVVKDGILNIDMAASANNVTISGIAVNEIPLSNKANLRMTSPE